MFTCKYLLHDGDLKDTFKYFEIQYYSMDKQLWIDSKIRGLIDGYELFFDIAEDTSSITDYCDQHGLKYDVYVYTKLNKSQQISIQLKR